METIREYYDFDLDEIDEERVRLHKLMRDGLVKSPIYLYRLQVLEQCEARWKIKEELERSNYIQELYLRIDEERPMNEAVAEIVSKTVGGNWSSIPDFSPKVQDLKAVKIEPAGVSDWIFKGTRFEKDGKLASSHDYGKVAYRAYLSTEPVPLSEAAANAAWDELPQVYKAAWEYVARAVRAAYDIANPPD